MVVVFFLGCAAPQPRSKQELQQIETGSPMWLLPSAYKFSTGSPARFDADSRKFVAMWHYAGTQNDQHVTITGSCAYTRPGLTAISMGYHTHEIAMTQHTCSGSFRFHIIQADRLDIDILTEAITQQTLRWSRATIDSFETEVNGFRFEVSADGSFAPGRMHSPFPHQSAGDWLDLGTVLPPFYYALTSPAGEIVFVGKVTHD